MAGRQPPQEQRRAGLWAGRERHGLPRVARVEGLLAEGGVKGARVYRPVDKEGKTQLSHYFLDKKVAHTIFIGVEGRGDTLLTVVTQPTTTEFAFTD